MKRSALGAALKLIFARRTESMKVKSDHEPSVRSANSRKERGTVATVPFYNPKSSRSSTTSIPLFNTSLTELEEPIEIDVPVEPDEFSPILGMQKFRTSLTNQHDSNVPRRGKLQQWNNLVNIYVALKEIYMYRLITKVSVRRAVF